MPLFFLLALLFFQASWLSGGEDIGSDVLARRVSVSEAPFLSEEEMKKAEAIAHFATGYLSMLEKNSFSEESFGEFLNAIRIDPEAKLPMSLITAEVLQQRDYAKWLEGLTPVAEMNPQATTLNLAVATILIYTGKYPEAQRLLMSSFSVIRRLPEEEKIKKNFKELVIYLLALTEKTGDIEEGSDIYSSAIKIPDVSGDFEFRRNAANFFLGCLQKKDDGFFSGWRKSRYERLLSENLSIVRKLWLDKVARLPEGKYPPYQELTSLFEAMQAAGRLEWVQDLVMETLLFNPADQEGIPLLAKIFSDMGQHRSAFRLWEKLSEKKPSEPFIFSRMGFDAMRDENYGESAKAYEWALLLFPDNSTAIYDLSLVYLLDNQLDKALLNLEKIKDAPDAQFLKAACLGRQGRYSEAAQALEKCEELARAGGREKMLDINFYTSLANYYEKAKEIDKAVATLRKLYESSEGDHELANFLGYVMADHGRELDEAEKLIRIAVEGEPGNPAYLDSMAWILFKKGRFQDALGYIEKALDKEGSLPDAVIADHAGDIYFACGDIRQALEFWKLALGTYSESLDKTKIEEKIKSTEAKNKGN